MTVVAERIRTAFPTLPRAERRVAYAILAAYPSAGLETVARLADRAAVSGPTVIRLVTRLGFGGFPEFQEALIEEIQERTTSPLVQYARRDPHLNANALDAAIPVLTEALNASLSNIDRSIFDSAVALLADERRRCAAAGGRFSSTITRTLVQHLEILRSNVSFLHSGEWVSYLMDARKGDVLTVVDVRRYQKATVSFAREAARRGVSVILITDPWLSPIAMDAELVLPVSVQSVSPFDSQVPAFALVEALIAGVVDARGDVATDRVSDYDALWDAQGFTESGVMD